MLLVRNTLSYAKEPRCYMIPITLTPHIYPLHCAAATVVRGRNTRNRLHATATQIRSVTYELEHMAAQLRVAKILGTSTNLMRAMRAMMPIQAVQKTCIEMSKEMFKVSPRSETL